MARHYLQPDKFLDRELSYEISRSVREVGAPALREMVDEGLRVFQRCSMTARGTDEHMGLLFPFHHLLECLDAAEILLATGASAPAGLQLRAALEALLGVEWVTREGLRYGAAYVVVDIHRRIANYEQYTRRHDRRHQLTRNLAASELGSRLRVPVEPDAEQKIDGLQQVLTRPHLRAAEAEFQRTHRKVRNPSFYALWDGPQKVDQLARRLGRFAEYHFLYRGWSEMMHATGLSRQLGSTDEGIGVVPFRNADRLSDGYVHALHFGVAAMHALLRFYRPQELHQSFPRWVARHVRPAFHRLANEP